MPPIEDDDDDVFEEAQDGSGGTESGKPKRSALDILRGRKEGSAGIMMQSDGSFTKDPMSGVSQGIKFLIPGQKVHFLNPFLKKSVARFPATLLGKFS